MKITKLAIAAAFTLAVSQGAIAQDMAAPLMDAEEIVISTQGALAAGNMIVPLFMLLFVAAALSAAAPVVQIPQA